MAEPTPSLADAKHDMNHALTALALELPAAVWDDVADKYDRLIEAYASVLLQKEASSTALAISTSEQERDRGRYRTHDDRL